MVERELDILLSEYERAQEAAQHADAVFWEVTSIIFGANTLLLGFVLETISQNEARGLITATAVLGVVLTMLVLGTYSSSKIGQEIAHKACRDIEARVPMYLKLHTQIAAAYPRRFVRGLIWLVTAILLLVWVLVGRAALGRSGVLFVVGAVVLFSLVLCVLWMAGRKKSRL